MDLILGFFLFFLTWGVMRIYWNRERPQPTEPEPLPMHRLRGLCGNLSRDADVQFTKEGGYAPTQTVSPGGSRSLAPPPASECDDADTDVHDSGYVV